MIHPWIVAFFQLFFGKCPTTVEFELSKTVEQFTMQFVSCTCHDFRVGLVFLSIELESSHADLFWAGVTRQR